MAQTYGGESTETKAQMHAAMLPLISHRDTKKPLEEEEGDEGEEGK